MKYKFPLLLCLVLLLSVSRPPQTAQKNAATVDQYEGIYLFSDSKPVAPYDYLGSVKSGGGGGMQSAQYEDVRDRLIKKCKKEYPQADGLILNLKSGATDKADAIKFK